MAAHLATERPWGLEEEEPVRLVRLAPSRKIHSPSIEEPIKILWARVIIRAVYDYVILKDSNKLKDRREFESVRKWLFEPSKLGNSLESLCRFLGWPVELVRERASTMTREEVRKLEFKERNNSFRALSNGDGQ